jgi:hypothetical protein
MQYGKQQFASALCINLRQINLKQIINLLQGMSRFFRLKKLHESSRAFSLVRGHPLPAPGPVPAEMVE